MREVPCPACDGARLKPVSLAVTVGGANISAIADLPISGAAEFLGSLDVSDRDAQIAARVLKEVNERLAFLMDVGLHYLSLSPPGGDAGRRRGAADPAGDTDRLRAGRGALRARRAVASVCTSATTTG